MRLVDADALCTHIENKFDGVCAYDVSGNEAAREFCDMVDIAPTIDAIPVEWLRDMMLECEAEESRAAWVVMREWEKGRRRDSG